MTINLEYFNQMIEVAAKLLGEDHQTVMALRDLQKNATSNNLQQAEQLIRALPTAHRDHIMAHTKLNLNQDAKTLRWIMEQADTPTSIPPGETKH